MNTLGKFIRTICDLPVVGGLFTLIVGVAPAVIPAAILGSGLLAGFLGGITLAAWCYFLAKKQIINIVFPVIPVPLWVVGIGMSLYAAFLFVTGADFETNSSSASYELLDSRTSNESEVRHWEERVEENAATQQRKSNSEQPGLPASWPAADSGAIGQGPITAEQYKEAMRRSFEAQKAMGMVSGEMDPKYMELPK